MPVSPAQINSRKVMNINRSYAIFAAALLSLLSCTEGEAPAPPCSSKSNANKPRIVQLLNKLFPRHVVQKGVSKKAHFEYEVTVDAKIDDSETLVCGKDGSLSEIQVAKTIITKIDKGKLTGKCRKRFEGFSNLIDARETGIDFTATHKFTGFVLRRLDKSNKAKPVKYWTSGASASISLLKGAKKAKTDDKKKCPLLEDKLAQDLLDSMFQSIPISRFYEMFTLCSTATADAVAKTLTPTCKGASFEFGKPGVWIFPSSLWAAPAKATFTNEVSLSFDNLGVFCEKEDVVSRIEYRETGDAKKDEKWLVSAKGSVEHTKKSELHCEAEKDGVFVLRINPKFAVRIDRTITTTFDDEFAIVPFDAAKGDVEGKCPSCSKITSRQRFEKHVRQAFNNEFEKLLDQATATAAGLIDCNENTAASVYKALNGTKFTMKFTEGHLSFQDADRKNFAVQCRADNNKAIVQIRARGSAELKKTGSFGMFYTLHDQTEAIDSYLFYYSGSQVRYDGTLGLRFDCTAPRSDAASDTKPGNCYAELDYGQTDLYDYGTISGHRGQYGDVYESIETCYKRRLLSVVNVRLSEAVHPLLAVEIPPGETYHDECFYNKPSIYDLP